MIKQPILTIGIPTFNRKDKLLETVAFFLKETCNLNVEILISDNGSTDGTYEAIQKIINKNKSSNLSIVRFNKNMGFDQNINNLCKNCKTKYIYLSSDDDVFKKGTVLKILNFVSNNNVAFAVLDFCAFNSKFKSLKLTEGGTLFDNYHYTDFFCYIRNMMTYVGFFILNINLYKKIKNPLVYDKTWFMFLGIAIESLKISHLPIGVVSGNFWQSGKPNKKLNYNYLEVFCSSLFDVVKKLGNLISKKEFKLIVNNTLNSFSYKNLLLYYHTFDRKHCRLSKNVFTKMKKYRNFWFVVLPWYFFPTSVYKLAVSLKCTFKKK